MHMYGNCWYSSDGLETRKIEIFRGEEIQRALIISNRHRPRRLADNVQTYSLIQVCLCKLANSITAHVQCQWWWKLAVVVMMWAVSAETIDIRGAKRYAETSHLEWPYTIDSIPYVHTKPTRAPPANTKYRVEISDVSKYHRQSPH